MVLDKQHGPFVQSIVRLLTVLVSTISNSQVFFAEKM